MGLFSNKKSATEAQAAQLAAARLTELSTALAELTARLEQFEHERTSLHTRLEGVHASTSSLDLRLTAVSTELRNQLDELGNELDRFGSDDPPPDGGPASDTNNRSASDEALEVLRTAQVKLAAEQARYEIAFRADLAALAEQVRHLRRS